jgi:hypothetical protein
MWLQGKISNSTEILLRSNLHTLAIVLNAYVSYHAIHSEQAAKQGIKWSLDMELVRAPATRPVCHRCVLFCGLAVPLLFVLPLWRSAGRRLFFGVRLSCGG